MIDICCVGHITSDKVVNTHGELYMSGGTAWYFSCALSKFPVNYLLVTAVADAELHYVDSLKAKGTEVKVQPSAHTVFFENIYGEDQDERTQNVLAKADPFDSSQFENLTAKIFHLGPLLADDISTPLIEALAKKGRVSLDVQGYLRKVISQKVHATDWPDAKKALQYVEIVKADVAELRTLSGCDTVEDGARTLASWGVKEVVITNGSKGSVIYYDGVFYPIPAYAPTEIVDATGCGDTYMAGYLYKRIKGESIQAAGQFAAGMAGLKTAATGPFVGTEEDVLQFMQDAKLVDF
jgi:sugar/nucleoside kinase (ribokinase family)